jgi:hypothetical protein
MRNLRHVLFLFLGAYGSYGQEKIPGIPFPLQWEIRPEYFEVKGNTLLIQAGAKTDMFRDPNVTYNTDTAPKLLFTPDDDFVLLASVQHSFAEKWDGGAIVLKADSLNWIKFCYEKDYLGSRRVVSVVTRNISDDCNSVSFESDKVYFKMAKAGPVITLYCSPDNKQWMLVRHFQFHSKSKIKVGFLAQSPLGKQCTVTFADIAYFSKRIQDPYAGE